MSKLRGKHPLDDKACTDNAYSEMGEAALKSKDNWFEELFLAGTYFQEKGNLDAAEKYLQHANKTDPSRPETYVPLIQLEQGRGDLRKAREYAQMLNKVEPNNSMYLAFLGSIHSRLKDYDEAATYLQSAVTLGTKEFWAHERLALAYFQRKSSTLHV